MKKEITIGGTILMLAAWPVLGADEMSSNHNQSLSYDQNPSDLYRANELSLDLFGGDTLGEHTIDNLSGSRIRHNSRLSAGLGLNYFITRYVGVAAEAYTESTAHSFVDDASGSLIVRLPIGETGLAPYVFGGGGHKFDPVVATFGHAGAGLEYRFSKNIGIFVDGRWVWPDRAGDYFFGRAGVRIAF
jgi:hypothetical protein